MQRCTRWTLAAALLAAQPAAAHCDGPHYRQFDFWLGEWDVVESAAPEGARIGHARVEAVAGGCALHEYYEQTDGLVGESLLSYDATRQAWQQTWITNRGSFMAIAGTATEGGVVLQGEVHTASGDTVLQRIHWRREGARVRESAELSRDGGATWTPAFDVLFIARDAAAR